MSNNAVELLVKSYHNAVAWGRGDHEEALQNAVNAAYPRWPEEQRAELYTRIAESWEEYRSGLVPRTLWIGQIVRKLEGERVQQAVRGLKVSN